LMAENPLFVAGNLTCVALLVVLVALVALALLELPMPLILPVLIVSNSCGALFKLAVHK
jgi:hypothetical protein